MLEDCKTAQERWGGVHSIIDKWLAERQQVLVLYCALTGVHDGHARALPATINEFVDLLVDYVSAGHFEVYQQLLAEGETFEDDKAVEAGERIIAHIQSSTDLALSFQDRVSTSANVYELCDWLERLGPSLESRFELEDQLIETLHNVHQNAF